MGKISRTFFSFYETANKVNSNSIFLFMYLLSLKRLAYQLGPGMIKIALQDVWPQHSLNKDTAG